MVIHSLNFAPGSLKPGNNINITSVYSLRVDAEQDVNIKYSGSGAVKVNSWAPQKATMGPGGNISRSDKLNVDVENGSFGSITLSLSGSSESNSLTATIPVKTASPLTMANLLKEKHTEEVFGSKSQGQIRKMLKKAGFKYDRSLKIWQID